MAGVMTGDRVDVEIKKERGGSRFRGFVKKITARKFKSVTGKVHFINPDTVALKDESFTWGEDLFLDNFSEYPEIHEDDYLIAEITSYPDSKPGFRGNITQILGDMNKADMDNIRVLNMHQIPHEFSKQCIQESKKFPSVVDPKDFKDRKDLREYSFITIDGPTAKDFDDAIFVEKQNNGYKLFVAIADVSHYVKPQTELDNEALLRGNSTYFPNFVAPMLPENISNELCSLKPNVDRLAFVAELFLGLDGEIQQSQFYEAVIKSHARVTYGEAQEIFDGGKLKQLKFIEPMLFQAKELAEKLMQNRFENGSLDMDVPEVVISVDPQGEPLEIQNSIRIFAHRLIEEFMLLANVAVARFFTKREINAIFRVHDNPRTEALDLLKGYLHQFGESLNNGDEPLQKTLTKVLHKYKGEAQSSILSILTLRSMSQAEYSSNNIGHFGLAFKDYTHFTSPIRRYADLVVHRLLKSALMPHKGYMGVPNDKLQHYGTLLSANEQRSVKSERQINSIKKARFMKQFVGQEFSGMISSVTKFGVFVLLRKYAVDGLVKIEFLGNDLFEFDSENLILRGQKTGKTFAIGDELNIVIGAVDREQGQIDFVLDEESLNKSPGGRNSETSKRKSAATGGDPKKRKSNKKDSGSVRKKRVRKSRGKG
mgnify:FL=1